MKRHHRLILIQVTLALTIIGIITYFLFPFEIWIRLNTRETQSSIIEQGKSLWKLETVQIGREENIQDLYFYNENLIYGINFGRGQFTLYKSFNGGKSWEQLSTIIDYSINDIFFISPTEGFIAATKLQPSSSIDENGSSILKTSDGGKTWETVFSAEKDVVSKIVFNSEGSIGVAVGSKATDNKWFSINFVLLTKDKGKTWTDISDNLNHNSVALNSAGRIDDSLINILFSPDNEIYVLSITRRIYKTTDEGRTWSLFSQLVDEPAQTSVHSFGILDNGRFWVGGGTISIEGKWGMVAIMNNWIGWETYRLRDYFFSDIKFLSNNEVIACGANVATNNFGGANEQNKGVILYSTDSGKTWVTVYESQTSKSFSINKISENKMFISGQNQEGVLLERFPNQ